VLVLREVTGDRADYGSSSGKRGLVRKYLIVILVVSILIRFAVACYLGDVVDSPPKMTDQRSYHALGVRLLEGRGFSFPTGWYPFTPPDTPTAHWSFLYSLWVAGIYALFGVHPLAVRLVQALVIGIVLPLAVRTLSLRLFPDRKRVAILAAGLVALYGYFVLYAATLMTESFYIPLVVIAMILSLEIDSALRSGGLPWRLALALGFCLGLAALMRQSILPWVPVLFAWVLWRAWRADRFWEGLSKVTLAGSVMLICILPVTIRNYLVYDRFLLLNSNAGYAMYSAQHPMHGTHFHEFEAAPLLPDLHGQNEAEMDRELMRRGLGFIAEDPRRYLLLSLSRVRAYFEFWPTQGTVLLHNIGRVGSFGLALPFMLYGYYLALRDCETRTRGALLILFVSFYSVMHILTWAMVRYRLPIDALSMPFAALGVDDLLTRLRRHGASQKEGLAPDGRDEYARDAEKEFERIV